MRIAGFRKLTLLDYPGKVACTVFTAGCNYRCPFCHNASLVLPHRTPEEIPRDEVLRFLSRRAGVLEGVCVTGGEPLLQEGLQGFLQELRSLGYRVKLDTNGSLPGPLRELLEKGLVDYVAMDIKNSPEKYPLTAGVRDAGLGALRESVSLLMESAVPCEFRTTVVREFHELEDIAAISRWIRGADRYYLQAFADSGDLIGEGFHPRSEEDMREMAKVARLELRDVGIRGI